jgi:flagellar biosynthetic protein FlhB
VARLRELLASGLRFDAASCWPRHGHAMRERLAESGAADAGRGAAAGRGADRLAALAAGVLSGGWNWTLKPLQPKFEQAQPDRRHRRHVLEAAAGRDAQGLPAGHWCCTVGGWLPVVATSTTSPALLAMPLPAALASAGDPAAGGLLLLLGVLALFALVDVPLQRWLPGASS